MSVPAFVFPVALNTYYAKFFADCIYHLFSLSQGKREVDLPDVSTCCMYPGCSFRVTYTLSEDDYKENIVRYNINPRKTTLIHSGSCKNEKPLPTEGLVRSLLKKLGDMQLSRRSRNPNDKDNLIENSVPMNVLLSDGDRLLNYGVSIAKKEPNLTSRSPQQATDNTNSLSPGDEIILSNPTSGDENETPVCPPNSVQPQKKHSTKSNGDSEGISTLASSTPPSIFTERTQNATSPGTVYLQYFSEQTDHQTKGGSAHNINIGNSGFEDDDSESHDIYDSYNFVEDVIRAERTRIESLGEVEENSNKTHDSIKLIEFIIQLTSHGWEIFSSQQNTELSPGSESAVLTDGAGDALIASDNSEPQFKVFQTVEEAYASLPNQSVTTTSCSIAGENPDSTNTQARNNENPITAVLLDETPDTAAPTSRASPPGHTLHPCQAPSSSQHSAATARSGKGSTSPMSTRSTRSEMGSSRAPPVKKSVGASESKRREVSKVKLPPTSPPEQPTQPQPPQQLQQPQPTTNDVPKPKELSEEQDRLCVCLSAPWIKKALLVYPSPLLFRETFTESHQIVTCEIIDANGSPLIIGMCLSEYKPLEPKLIGRYRSAVAAGLQSTLSIGAATGVTVLLHSGMEADIVFSYELLLRMVKRVMDEIIKEMDWVAERMKGFKISPPVITDPFLSITSTHLEGMGSLNRNPLADGKTQANVSSLSPLSPFGLQWGGASVRRAGQLDKEDGLWHVAIFAPFYPKIPRVVSEIFGPAGHYYIDSNSLLQTYFHQLLTTDPVYGNLIQRGLMRRYGLSLNSSVITCDAGCHGGHNYNYGCGQSQDQPEGGDQQQQREQKGIIFPTSKGNQLISCDKALSEDSLRMIKFISDLEMEDPNPSRDKSFPSACSQLQSQHPDESSESVDSVLSKIGTDLEIVEEMLLIAGHSSATILDFETLSDNPKIYNKQAYERLVFFLRANRCYVATKPHKVKALRKWPIPYFVNKYVGDELTKVAYGRGSTRAVVKTLVSAAEDAFGKRKIPEFMCDEDLTSFAHSSLFNGSLAGGEVSFIKHKVYFDCPDDQERFVPWGTRRGSVEFVDDASTGNNQNDIASSSCHPMRRTSLSPNPGQNTQTLTSPVLALPSIPQQNGGSMGLVSMRLTPSDYSRLACTCKCLRDIGLPCPRLHRTLEMYGVNESQRAVYQWKVGSLKAFYGTIPFSPDEGEMTRAQGVHKANNDGNLLRLLDLYIRKGWSESERLSLNTFQWLSEINRIRAQRGDDNTGFLRVTKRKPR